MVFYRRLSSAAPALLGLFVLTLAYLPVSKMSVVGDDFQFLFGAHGLADGSFGRWIELVLQDALSRGLVRPIGTIADAIFQYFALPVSSALSLPPRGYYFVFGLISLWTLVLTATWFMRQAFTHFAKHTTHSPQLTFMVLSIVTAITLQIHPWSNDPVTTYLVQGFGSAILAFVTLTLTLRATSEIEKVSGRSVYLILGMLTGAIGVLFYEILVAVIPAQALIIIYKIHQSRGRNKGLLKPLFTAFILLVGVPALVFVMGRVISALLVGEGDVYAGTSLELSFAGLRTLVNGTVSILPFGAWGLSFSRFPLLIVSPTILVGITVFGILLALALAISVKQLNRGLHWNNWVIPVVVMVLTGLLAVSAHAFTPKYIAEVNEPGLVYLFYLLGFMCVNTLLAGFFLSVKISSVPIIGLMITFSILSSLAFTQLLLNNNLASVSLDMHRLNSTLSNKVTSTESNEFERCSALASWSKAEWPDYYRESILKSVPTAFERLTGREFCDSTETLE